MELHILDHGLVGWISDQDEALSCILQSSHVVKEQECEPTLKAPLMTVLTHS